MKSCCHQCSGDLSRWRWSRRNVVVWTLSKGQSLDECCESPSAERCITAALKRCATGHWGNIQKYRYFGFRGHVEPSSAEHDVARVTRWRNSEWWHEHKARLPAKTGGQHRRRPQDLSNPCHDKAPMQKALKHAQGKVWWAALEEALREAGLRIATPLRRYVALGGRSEDGLHSGRRCKEAW